ncbi:MAG: minor capsid protein [Clostridia bacterium]|nr:minor capsid protein [Clostridia bacterium]
MGYWENRQADVMYDLMEDAEDTSKELADVYAKACRELSGKMEDIFTKYASRYSLSDSEALQLLNQMHTKGDINELLNLLKKDSKNADLLADLESGAYRARIERLQNLQDEVDSLMKDVYNQEKQISTNHYIDTAQNAYYREIYSTERQVGFQFSFSAIDPDAVNMVLSSKWSGANYSDRIWANTQALAADVKQQMLLGLLTGKSQEDMAQDIASKYATGAFQARRLVRTESNFVSGQMQKQAYDECGADEYDFVAVLDVRTSDICRELDGKTFKVSEMEAGVNCNPMHPFCRSTTTIHLDDDVKAGLQRRARDPVTGENKLVPASTDYKKWYQDNVANNPKAQAAEKMVKNYQADAAQYERYRKLIGSRAGKTMREFQTMKYSDPEKWSKARTDYKDARLKNRIQSDSTKKNIESSRQNRYIQGSGTYRGGSYITVSDADAQELVNKYAGKGRIIREADGTYTGKELITTKRQVGMVKDKDGNMVPTKSFIIRYETGGAYIVPVLKEDY